MSTLIAYVGRNIVITASHAKYDMTSDSLETGGEGLNVKYSTLNLSASHIEAANPKGPLMAGLLGTWFEAGIIQPVNSTKACR